MKLKTYITIPLAILIGLTASVAVAIAGSAIESGGGAALVGGTAGQIPYADTASSITTEASGFAWDSTNNRLGIGDDTPDATLDIAPSSATIPAFIATQTLDNNSGHNAVLQSSLTVNGTSAANLAAIKATITQSYTNGGGRFAAVEGIGTTRSTGQNLGGYFSAGGNPSNFPSYNIGVQGYANANAYSSVGVLGTTDVGSTASVGVVGEVLQPNSGSGAWGGWFSLGQTSGFVPEAKAAIGATNRTYAYQIAAFYDNSTQVFTIEDGGEVGIGNDSTPDAWLEVSSSSATAAEIYLSNTSTGDSKISFGAHDTTRKWSIGMDNSTANDNFSISIGGTLGTQEIIQIDGLSAVTRFNAGVIFSMPDTQTITAGATINAAACGTMQKITSAGDVTTSTTNTFAAPSVDNTGCCFDVVNTGSANITLDNNAKFASAGGADVVLGASDSLRVCSDGVKWYMIGAKGDN